MSLVPAASFYLTSAIAASLIFSVAPWQHALIQVLLGGRLDVANRVDHHDMLKG